MGKANALWRHEDHMIGIEDDNKGVLVIPLEHVRQNKVLICDEGDKIHKKIKEATLKLLELEVFIYPKIGKKKMASSWKKNRCTSLVKKIYDCK